MKHLFITIYLISFSIQLPVYSQNENAAANYSVNGTTVSQQEFESFQKTLKEIPGTWFCAETLNGGITGFNARDGKGNVYRCESAYINGVSKNSIRRENLP